MTDCPADWLVSKVPQIAFQLTGHLDGLLMEWLVKFSFVWLAEKLDVKLTE